MAVEDVVSVSVWETLGVVLGKVGLVSSGWRWPLRLLYLASQVKQS